LLDPAGYAIAMHRPYRIQRFQDHQVERALKNLAAQG
jgi:hypothetical protein